MSVFAIADLHFATAQPDKAMDIFPGWQDYMGRIGQAWREAVRPGDTVVVPGDISWAMALAEARGDLLFLDSLPGRKIILKGNHDYWWSSGAKMQAAFLEFGVGTIDILHNNSYAVEGLVLCGTRGWVLDSGAPEDQKITAREAQRLQLSLDHAGSAPGERVVFLHYPPIQGNSYCEPILDVLSARGIGRCYYGHLHGDSARYAFQGRFAGTAYTLVAADALGFRPLQIA